MTTRIDTLSHVERVVIKVGTSLTWDSRRGFNPRVIRGLVKGIAALRARGLEVVLVTSGAIGAGMNRLKMKERPATIPAKQATAAVGQVFLMDLYERIFSEVGMDAGQVLLTRLDLESGQRYFNARNTLETLLDMGVVPIVNENDTVAVDEIKFGDNDRLAALVTNLVKADLLVILTDVEGLMDKDPKRFRGAKRVPTVKRITRAIEKSSGGAGTVSSTGGMLTKVQAARMVTENGEHMIVADGREKRVLRRLMKGEDLGTLFMAQPLSSVSRLRWMPYTTPRAVGVVVRAEAVRRLKRGGERLYCDDVKKIVGGFQTGWALRLVDGRGKTFAKGLSLMSSVDLKKVMARQAKQKSRKPMVLVRYEDIAFKKKI